MTEQQAKAGEPEGAAEGRSKEERAEDRWAIVIAVVLMAIFLTWIGCAVAVWIGWAI